MNLEQLRRRRDLVAVLSRADLDDEQLDELEGILVDVDLEPAPVDPAVRSRREQPTPLDSLAGGPPAGSADARVSARKGRPR